MVHSNRPVISICLFILFAGACSVLKAQNNASPNKYNLEGVYDTLYVDATVFKKISNHKLVFQYYQEGGRFSLHGWTAQGLWGRKFTTNPGLILASGNAGPITYVQSKYFGDLVLDTRQIKRIKDSISRTTARWVLFAPKLLDGVMNYEVMLTTDPNWLKKTSIASNVAPPPSAPAPPPTSPTSTSLSSTDVIANPSPPRNFKKI